MRNIFNKRKFLCENRENLFNKEAVASKRDIFSFFFFLKTKQETFPAENTKLYNYNKENLSNE